MCEAFPQTFAASDKLRTTGNPVRPELFTLAPRAALEGRKARLLVLGGSLGAEPLNKLLPEALANVAAELRPEVFHQAGKQHDEITAQRTPRSVSRQMFSPSSKTWPTLMAGPTWWFAAQAR